jgi:hypothetical protein
MDRIDLGLARNAQHIRDVEVGLDRAAVATHEVGFVRFRAMQREAIFLRIDRDRAQAEFTRGAHDTDRNFAAIGDEYAADVLHARILRKNVQFTMHTSADAH